jgi:mRNA interferase YafQ
MADKRAKPPRACDYAKVFSKDWERLSKSGRHDMNRLKDAMLLLVGNDGPLGEEWKDHSLKGEWAGYRECHVGGDFLLIYKIDEQTGKGGRIVFIRAGTHSDLFKE